ncbi:MAG: LiaF transmembrane domain-containing protein [Thermoplasmatota archaeon]
MRGRILVGLVLLIAGVAWFLSLLGYPVFPGGFDTWWPLLIVLFGLVQLISGRWAVLSGVFFIVLGGLLQALRLDYIHGDWWAYVGALIIVFFGLSVLFAPWRRRWWRNQSMASWAPAARGNDAVFSNVERRFEGEFSGARLGTIFGRLDVDLRRASLPAEGATLELETIFGHVDVRVPDTWRVEIRGGGVAGRVQNYSRAPTDPNAPHLIVETGPVFGAVEIVN